MLFRYIHLGNLRAAVQHSPQARRAGEGPAALSPAGPARPRGKPVSSTRLLPLPRFPKLLRNKTAAGAGRAFPRLSALLMLLLPTRRAHFNPTDASTHIFGGPGTTCHIGGEISIMQMGYFTFANYLIQAFSGFGCCEIQQLSKLLVLYLWRWQEAPVSDTRNWVWGELLSPVRPARHASTRGEEFAR